MVKWCLQLENFMAWNQVALNLEYYFKSCKKLSIYIKTIQNPILNELFSTCMMIILRNDTKVDLKWGFNSPCLPLNMMLRNIFFIVFSSIKLVLAAKQSLRSLLFSKFLRVCRLSQWSQRRGLWLEFWSTKLDTCVKWPCVD